METFSEYLSTIDNPQHRERMEEILRRVAESFPGLSKRIAWSQPMFTDHGTFIIGFSVAKKHLAIAPESKTIARFSDEIKQAGYMTTAAS
jgi:uncharacterized protein YdhG (YjbR/CyaY superfamily)